MFLESGPLERNKRLGIMSVTGRLVLLNHILNLTLGNWAVKVAVEVSHNLLLIIAQTTQDLWLLCLFRVAFFLDDILLKLIPEGQLVFNARSCGFLNSLDIFFQTSFF